MERRYVSPMPTIQASVAAWRDCDAQRGMKVGEVAPLQGNLFSTTSGRRVR